MNNNDILNELHNDSQSFMPSAKLDPSSIENSLSNVHRKNHKGVTALCVSLGVVCLTVLGVGLSSFTHPTLPVKNDTSQVDNYNEIYSIVKSVKRANEDTIWEQFKHNIFGYAEYETMVDGEFAMNSVSGVSKDVASLTTGQSQEHSDTNIQVKGVDEADVVKTDGEYIYSVYNNEIIITKANNGNPEKVSSIKSDSDIRDLYIYEDSLVAFSAFDLSYYGNIVDMDKEFYDNVSTKFVTLVYTYDITDINNPTEISTLLQAGSYLSSRRIDDVVYLTTKYRVTEYDEISKENPETYCPFFNAGDSFNCIEPEEIIISENLNYVEYITVSSIDLNKPQEFTDICSVMGSGSEIYSSLNNLYVASRIYTDDSINTEIMRFSINGAEITHNNTLTIDGGLLNQFSMDEHNGFFRVVTEIEDYDYSYDEDFLTNSISSFSDNTKTALYVFDSELNLVGKTDDVAKGEHVKSVRFDGDIAYFVTFRQTDPLFTVDLSDPQSPKILSELKIPGFSEYLHVFGDSLLLGFGREADIYTGGAEGLKLTMFDTSDKTNVTELATRIFTDSNVYSIAEDNHKAIFVDEEKGIIGIPYQVYGNDSQGYYAIFRYDSELNDFVLCKEISIDNYHEYIYAYTGSYIRGLYIGDYFYVVTPEKIYALDYNTFELLN